MGRRAQLDANLKEELLISRARIFHYWINWERSAWCFSAEQKVSSAGTSIMSNAQMANEAIYHMISRAGMRPMEGGGWGWGCVGWWRVEWLVSAFKTSWSRFSLPSLLCGPIIKTLLEGLLCTIPPSYFLFFFESCSAVIAINNRRGPNMKRDSMRRESVSPKASFDEPR